MLLFGKRLLEQALYDLEIDIRQRGDDPDVRDILHQDSRAYAVESLITQS